jgi:hypothetical protein
MPSVRHLVARPISGAEASVLDREGLVIAGGVDVPSFHLGYSALFKAHDPVYITADAILHALHRSYDHILADVERWALVPELSALLAELQGGVAGVSGASAEARADLDLYLAVARSLLDGKPAPPLAGARPEEIARLVAAAEAAAGPAEVPLFGGRALVDLSMLKPRGHYTREPGLERYFRATMWLGRTEIRLARREGGAWRVDRRGLAAALLLHGALSGRAATAHRRLDEATSVFVGPADALSFGGLARAAEARGLARVEDLGGLDDAGLAKALSGEAAQRIGSRMLERGDEPLDFVVLGQRYVLDSEVFSAVTYGKIAALRMMPSPLDVGWGVFQNPEALSLLAPELARYGYRAALDDVARRGREAGPALWEGSLYHLWLRALQGLSPDPRADATLPAVMRGEAWSRRMLSTQLASWAELRHDTVLYAKQSFSAMALCAFPDAYVEPYPAFFAAVERLSARGAALLAGLEFGAHEGEKRRILAYFGKLGATAGRLRQIAEREREDRPIDAAQLDFINHAVSVDGRSAGCTMVIEPGGWYADLHYDRDDVLSHKPVIADVHTQPTDEGGAMVGRVLHVATGMPRPFAVTLSTCAGKRTFKGFVSSYHEVVTGGFNRLDDAAWAKQRATAPDVPWMRGLVVR